jgi:uncharacterized protein
LAYNSVGNSFAVWDKFDREIYDIVAEGSGVERAMSVAGNERYLVSVLENLRKGSFIVDRGLDERKKIEDAVNLIRFDDRHLSITIAPTLLCNFACDYCYQGDHAGKTSMSDDISDKLLGFVRRKIAGKSSISVAWYGGEPLLAKDILFQLSEKLIAACKEQNVSYDGSIVTNGYLLTRDVAKRLAELNVSRAQVTLDGDRDVHDRRRLLKGGGATFDRLVANLVDVVEDERLNIKIRVNIDRRNRDSIEGLLNKLRDAGLAGRRNFSVYFASVDVCSRECLKIASEVMPLEEYAELEMRLLKTASKLGLANLSMPFRMFSICSAVKPNGFVILPNGDVHKCWNTVSHPDERIGSIDDIDGADSSEKQKRWLGHNLVALPECEKCPILVNCAGGCAEMSRKGLMKPCRSLKYNISDRLLLLAVSHGAIKEEDAVRI